MHLVSRGVGSVKMHTGDYRCRSGNAKSAQTDRATWPLTTYPRAERPGICEDSYSVGRFETMKNCTYPSAKHVRIVSVPPVLRRG
jgi:hypothetical protein